MTRNIAEKTRELVGRFLPLFEIISVKYPKHLEFHSALVCEIRLSIALGEKLFLFLQEKYFGCGKSGQRNDDDKKRIHKEAEAREHERETKMRRVARESVGPPP